MNLCDIPSKVTVRLDITDRLALKQAIEDGLIPSTRKTTAEVFRFALRRLVPPAALGKSTNPKLRRKR